MVFALGATGKSIERQERRPVEVTRVEHDSSRADIDAGRLLFNQYCLVCHGYGAVGGGVIADLRESRELVFDNYEAILLDGRRIDRGMPAFADVLDRQKVELLRSYVLHRRDMLIDQQAASGGGR